MYSKETKFATHKFILYRLNPIKFSHSKIYSLLKRCICLLNLCVCLFHFKSVYPYHDTSFGCGDGENGRCNVGGPTPMLLFILDKEFRVAAALPTTRTMPFVRSGGIAGVAPTVPATKPYTKSKQYTEQKK